MFDGKHRDAIRKTACHLSDLLEQRVCEADIQTLLPEDTIGYLSENLRRLSDVSLIWQAMDDEWDRAGASFRPGTKDAVAQFYASPVWLLNGIFTEIDVESHLHRKAIADFVVRQSPALVSDYGGGIGSLARQIALTGQPEKVTVVEPYPSPLAIRLVEDIPNLTYQAELPVNADVVIAQDVLEHVTDPLAHFAQLLAAVRDGGLVITANCFQPVILCHYPGAFHFHFTFSWIAAALGCKFEGSLVGAPHVQVFRRTSKEPNWFLARSLERLSRAAYPGLRIAQKLKRYLRFRSCSV